MRQERLSVVSSLDPCGPVSPEPIPILSMARWQGGGLRRRPVMQPLPVAVDLHAGVLGVPHDRSLDEALHVVVVGGLEAGARGAVLGSVGHALRLYFAWPMRDARSGERSPRVRGGAAVRLEQDDVRMMSNRDPFACRSG